MDREELARWESRFADHLRANGGGDTAHDLAHVRRVVRSAERIARVERAALEVVLPAAWLHDIVYLPKEHPDRRHASRLSAEAAAAFLKEIEYPGDLLPDIRHCIEAHSFSANVEPRTLEACVVQDADRLDALGAIGIARCFATSGAMGRALYNEEDPFAAARPLDDLAFALDHFEKKLFRVAETLRTSTARSMAKDRVTFMRAFLGRFRCEIVHGD